LRGRWSVGPSRVASNRGRMGGQRTIAPARFDSCGTSDVTTAQLLSIGIMMRFVVAMAVL